MCDKGEGESKNRSEGARKVSPERKRKSDISANLSRTLITNLNKLKKLKLRIKYHMMFKMKKVKDLSITTIFLSHDFLGYFNPFLVLQNS